MYLLTLFFFFKYTQSKTNSEYLLHRALGQGAFGEVYQGFYKTRAGDAVEMPVAVKVRFLYYALEMFSL